MSWFCSTFRPNQNNQEIGSHYRKTIKRIGKIEGQGLHSGKMMKIIFHPAESGTGLQFYKKNCSEKNLQVSLKNVTDTSLAVTLKNSSYQIQTVEHLTYSIYCLGITDMIMEIEGGSEIPILDGGAKTFFDILNSLGIHQFAQKLKPLIITKPISVSDGDRYIVALPSKGLSVSYFIDYPHPLLKDQFLEVNFNNLETRKHIAQARTFSFEHKLNYLRSKGLAQGGSLESVLIYSLEKTINPPKFKQESLHHKILDLIGDLALIGQPLVGHILASKAGHSLNIAFARKLIKSFS